ncbi:MAG: 5'/3'-nucleotidase SurE [Bacteroidales bacterium]|nr:5'/3'-nucleotidase SurE [Bacteroidales bacterium]
MKILLVNDDGINAKGLQSLASVMKQFGEVTVVAPKHHQSGTSMAISLGIRPIAAKFVGEKEGIKWHYLDATPASCAKYAIDMLFQDELPDVIVSGINHGLNSSTAVWYSGTIGAAREGALAGIISIGVSLDNLSHDADFSTVEEMFPDIFRSIMANARTGIVYNVNFPDLPPEKIKGIKVTTQGFESWIKEFVPYNKEMYDKFGVLAQSDPNMVLPVAEEGEVFYMMAGEVIADPGNTEFTDNYANEHGYISITPQSIDNTDYDEFRRLQGKIK